MHATIDVEELQHRLHTVLNDVSQKHIPYILTGEDHPQAALIPYEDFLRFQTLQEKEVLAHFDRLVARMAVQNAAYDEEEVATDLTATRMEQAD